MPKAPAFQWYPKDCDTDENVRDMSDAEFGFYMRCLNHAWLNFGLPADLPKLARIMNRSLRYVEKAWKRVGLCFELRDGRYWNPKQEEQRETAKQFANSRKIAATSRWNSSGEHKPTKKSEQKLLKTLESTDARASIMHCSASPSPSASASVIENTPTTWSSVPGSAAPGCVRVMPKPPNVTDLNGIASDRFEEFWELYPLKQRRDFAYQQFISVVTVESEALFFACLKRYLASDQVSRGVLANPDKWIREQHQARWEGNWPPPRAAPVRLSPSAAAFAELERRVASGEVS